MKKTIFFLSLLLLFSMQLESRRKFEALINLGTGINSNCNELNPIITSDGKTLYFCRDECPNGDKKQNIWVAKKFNNGTWGKAKKIGSPLNNQYNNFISSVSPDGNSILLGSVYRPDGKMERGVSISYRTAKGWSFPKALDIEGYYNLNPYSGFFLAGDGKTLLLSIERKDSYGGKDLYVSIKHKNNKWSTPKNMGPIINTKEEEISPFLANDGVTLYFSSEGHGGFGNADIFMSRRLDDSWTSWSQPENLGKEVNTPDWDAYYKMDAEAEYAYCVSRNNSIGNSDIFKYKIPDNLKPRPVMLIKGHVKCYKRLIPIDAEIDYEILPVGTEYGSARSNPADGAYNMALPAGKYYSYRSQAENYIGTNEDINLEKLYKYKEIGRDIWMIPAEDSLICIRNVFFSKGRSNLSEESLRERMRLIDFLRENPNTVCLVTGYTDNTGPMEVNEKLSNKRAQNAVNFLLDQGIKQERIHMKGFAKDKYVRPNDTPEDRALNRRVEFKVYEI